MKKLFLLFLLIPSLALAGQGMGPGPGVKGYAACSDTQQTDTSGTSNALYINYDTSKEAVAGSFTANGTYTIYHVTVKLRKIGSPTGSVTAYLCTNNSDEPSSTCTSSTNTIDPSTCSTSGDEKTFNFAGYAVTNSTRYWVKMVGSWADSTANYIQAYFNTSGSEITKHQQSDTVWAATDLTSLIYHTISSCP